MLKDYHYRLAARIIVLSVCLSLLLAPAATIASVATTTFSVTATVSPTCLISSNTLSFGTYTGTAINATTTLSATCSNTTTYAVGLNPGTGSGATVSNRLMTGPSSATLGYALYRDSGRLLNWGQTVGSDTLSGTGSGSAQILTVYGTLTGGQYPTPGSYSDTVTATLTY